MRDEAAAAEEAFADLMFRADPSIAPRIGAQRACPDCGRPQHWTGTEHGWAHDARLISHLTPGCTCDHRPGDPCNASCPIHLGAGLRRA